MTTSARALLLQRPGRIRQGPKNNKGRVAAALEINSVERVENQDFVTFSIEETRTTFDDSSSLPTIFTSKPNTSSGLSSFSIV